MSKKPEYYQRPDGLYEKMLVIDGKRIAFRDRDPKNIIKKIAAYTGTIKTGPKFKPIAEKWQKDHWTQLHHNTIRSYDPAVKRAIDEFGETYVKQIKPSDINSFIVKFSKGKAQKTVRTQLSMIHMIFAQAVLDGIIEFNPAEYIQIPKNLPKAPREFPTPEDIEAVKNNANLPFGLFAYFLLYTGCRRGEALALTHGDIDQENKIIRINKSVYHVGNHPNVKTPKTAAGRREIILLDRLAEKLPSGKPGEYLFPNKAGEMMSNSQVEKGWEAYCKAAGIDITPHQLRHAYATILHDAGIDAKDASELLGHTTIEMTKNIYTHITKSRKEKTAEILNHFDG